MKVLFLNWRNTDHSQAGGAEKYISDIRDYLISQEHSVTIYSKGNFFTVYIWGIIFALRHKNEFDVIIDCDNGISFFTPLLIRNKKIFCLFHHVHKDIFKKYLIWPLSSIAIFIEKYIIARIYKTYIAVSPSTKLGLEKLGVPPEHIKLVHSGVSSLYISGEKSSVPTVCYVGRLKKYKRVDTLLFAWKKVLQQIPNAQLTIAGIGDDAVRLQKISAELNLTNSVCFKGYVSEAEKINIFQSSWISVLPSEIEGWGMTVIESNACGTPTIGSNVPGLVDSIKDNYSGFLFTLFNHDELARKITDFINLPIEDRNLFNTQAKKWGKQFTIQQSGKDFLAIIN